MITKKFLSLILALLMLFGGAVTLFSCVKEDTGAQDSQTEASSAESESGSAETEEGREPLKLIENGSSEYIVVYPNDASDVIMSAVDMLLASIKSKTGVTLNSKSDNLRGAAFHDPSEKAILIGKTNYEESQVVLDSLGRFEYKIAQIENKMVIVALNDADVKKAIEYYIANLIKPNVTGEEGAKTLLLEEYHYIPEDTDKNSFAINGTDISEFSIVYPKDDGEYKTIGKELQSVVLQKLGVELPMYSDKEAEQENEILLGKTTRSFSQSLYSNLQNYLMTYSFEVSGDKLQILSGGYYSAMKCVADMPFFVLANGKVNFTDGSHRKTEILANPTELTSDADIRIMTANLLNSEWADSRLDVKYRAEMFAGVLRDYRPDAVGLQEVDARWQTELDKWLEILREEYDLEYTLHNNKNPNDGANVICMIFRSDLYTCAEEDTHMFPHWNQSYSQGVSIPMCRLQSKTNNAKEFILMNTHWDVDLWEGAQKDICSEESAAFVNEWKSAGVPIFFTGDWNANRGRDCLENFITATDAQTADEGQYCIEWTFYWGEDVTAKNNVCLSQYSVASDHPFRYTDFDLW